MGISAAERAHRAASDRERVLWVDEQDRPLGVLPRAELRRRGLIGRGTFVLLFNGAGHICVHQRTAGKAVYPSYFDMCAGGMVGEGESYLLCARRELQEELGIQAESLHEYGRFFFQGPGNRLWGAVFSAVSDQPPRAQPEEVQAFWFASLEELAADIQRRPYCPDSLRAFERYRLAGDRGQMLEDR